MKSILKENEKLLKGGWIIKNGKISIDSITERIEYLIFNCLKKIQDSSDGWDMLYKDPNDSRYWELVYIESESHGGGAPTLRLISKERIEEKYDFLI